LRAELTAQVQREGLEGRVLFLGERTDVAELLAASDLFILPSLWEGMSLAMLEALASGLPVIASDVSGTRQVIRDGEDGLLVAPQDAAGLGAAMSGLLSNPARARELARTGRARVECFTLERRARAYLELYNAPARDQANG
jgi:glycosyltransferase involved in cell wall biosynthesis